MKKLLILALLVVGCDTYETRVSCENGYSGIADRAITTEGATTIWLENGDVLVYSAGTNCVITHKTRKE